VLLSALVAHPDFNITFRCGIRDVSNEGARLKAPPQLCSESGASRRVWVRRLVTR
jgi:hypothetical protein